MTEDAQPADCLVCHGPLFEPFAFSHQPATRLNCSNCGEHLLSRDLVHGIDTLLADETTRARVAHALRKFVAPSLVTVDMVQALVRSARLPPAMERIDRLVMYLAERYAPGADVNLSPPDLRAQLGCVTEGEVEWVLEQALTAGLIRAMCDVSVYAASGGLMPLAALSYAGWQRHAQLMRDGAGSRHAFVAMKFGDAQLDVLFRDHLQPAVDQTGFELRVTSGNHQTAGSIDNRMRVELRTSRFVVCDLTHGNRGAYWEAGYAEGLGRPVIYLCRRDVLEHDDHDTRPHFDIRQQLIIAWDPGNPGPAMDTLKATIRATLPDEARLEDT